METITESSINNNKAPENLNDKLLEWWNDRVIIPSYLLSPLSIITDPGNSSEFKLVKDQILNRVNDLLIQNTVTVNLYNNLLTFCDTGKQYEVQGDLLKMVTNKNYNADLAILSDKTCMSLQRKCFLMSKLKVIILPDIEGI